MEEDPLPQTADLLVDVVVIASSPKKWVAYRTIRAYGKAAIATATALPASLALGGALTISQAQARHPEAEPHVPSQTQNTVMERMPMIIVTSTSSGSGWK